jgi:hypothetical protein
MNDVQFGPTIDLYSILIHSLQAVSIPGIVFVVWKASRWFTKMEDQIERLLSNHLEHAQDSLDKLNAGQNAALTEMKELRADLRELLRR